MFNLFINIWAQRSRRNPTIRKHGYPSIQERVLEIVNFSDFKEIYEGKQFTAGNNCNDSNTLNEFENGGFTLKTHQSYMFSLHTTPKKCLKLSGKSHDSKISVFMFLRKRNAGVFKFLRFEERFRKALFSWRMLLIVESKLPFSTFTGAFCCEEWQA